MNKINKKKLKKYYPITLLAMEEMPQNSKNPSITYYKGIKYINNDFYKPISLLKRATQTIF